MREKETDCREKILCRASCVWESADAASTGTSSRQQHDKCNVCSIILTRASPEAALSWTPVPLRHPCSVVRASRRDSLVQATEQQHLSLSLCSERLLTQEAK